RQIDAAALSTYSAMSPRSKVRTDGRTNCRVGDVRSQFCVDQEAVDEDDRGAVLARDPAGRYSRRRRAGRLGGVRHAGRPRGAGGATVSAPKLYVWTSNVRPVESVGVTVTVEPCTVTLRKWNTWALLVGTGADPHLLPVPLL